MGEYPLHCRHLLSTQHQNQSPKSINDVMPVIGARFYSQLDAMQGRYDILERELSKVLNQNVKLGFRLVILVLGSFGLFNFL